MGDALFRQKAPVVMGWLIRDFPALDVNDAAAILGNIGGESGGFTLMQEKNPIGGPGARGGWGWCQWTGPRRRQFESWSDMKGLARDSDEANYGFLVHELKTTESKSIQAVRNAGDLKAKVIAFERAFERAGIPHWEGRVKWAELALKCYGGGKLAPLPKPPDIERVPPQPPSVFQRILAAVAALFRNG